MARCKNH